MNTFEWENGTVIERPYVEIDGVKHYVEDGEVSGGTPATANNLNEMQEILGGNFQLKGKLLWTNPNPTADFATQTINLSSSDYDILEWYYRSDAVTNLTFCQKSLKGSGTQFMYSSQGSGSRHWIRRVFWVNNTQFSCADCLRVDGTSTSIGNEQDVPLYVVGYKTGLFE